MIGNIDWSLFLEFIKTIPDYWKILLTIGFFYVLIIYKTAVIEFIKNIKIFKIKHQGTEVSGQTFQAQESAVYKLNKSESLNDDKIMSGDKDQKINQGNGEEESTVEELQKKVDLLEKQNAEYNKILAFERVLNGILGTQLELLNVLYNKTQGISYQETTLIYYKTYVSLCNPAFHIMSEDQYLKFLFNWNLIQIDNLQMVSLTEFGKLFMDYKLKNYRDLYRNL